MIQHHVSEVRDMKVLLSLLYAKSKAEQGFVKVGEIRGWKCSLAWAYACLVILPHGILLPSCLLVLENQRAERAAGADSFLA